MKVRLLPPCDKLVRNDDALLLYPDELIRLSGLGAAITDLAIASISVSDLSDELAERFGEPEGTSAKQATQTIVDELVGRGVLEIV